MVHLMKHRQTTDTTKLEVWDSEIAGEVNRSLFPPSVANPFIQQTYLSAWRWARIILLGTVLVPVRVSCIAFLFLLLWLMATLSTLNLPT